MADDLVLVSFTPHVGGQDHVVEDEIVDAQSREDVPPAVAFEKEAQWPAEIGASPGDECRTEDVVQVPYEEAKDEEGEGKEQQLILVVSHLSIRDDILRGLQGFVDDSEVQDCVEGLMEDWITVDVDVGVSEEACDKEGPDVGNQMPWLWSVPAPDVPKRYCSDPDHRQLVHELVLVREGGVEHEAADTDRGEAQRYEDVQQAVAIFERRVDVVAGQEDEPDVRKGVDDLRNVRGEEVVFFTPVDGGGGGSPVGLKGSCRVGETKHG